MKFKDLTNIEFIGVLKNSEINRMYGRDVMGIGATDSEYIIGHITGNLQDLYEGNIFITSKTENLDDFIKRLVIEDRCNAVVNRCAYKAACRMALDDMPEDNEVVWTIMDGGEITFDLTKIKEDLKSKINEV